MNRVTIHETLTEEGTRETVDVGAEDGSLVVHVAGEATLLPMTVLERLLDRYGKPLEDGIPIVGPSVDLGGGKALCVIRHLGTYDVIARDFVVFTSPDREPLAELATSISAALVHFVRAARAG